MCRYYMPPAELVAHAKFSVEAEMHMGNYAMNFSKFMI